MAASSLALLQLASCSEQLKTLRFLTCIFLDFLHNSLFSLSFISTSQQPTYVYHLLLKRWPYPSYKYHPVVFPLQSELTPNHVWN